MKKFRGFTLTELMVALTVIGVLVAVVTPAIMKTRPNKNKMMVKKTFYTTEQAVSTLINDEILYPDMREACRTEQDNDDDIYCAWGFDYVYPVRYEGSEYSGDYKFAALFKEQLNVSQNDAASKVSNATPDDGDFYPIFYTTDGVKWDLRSTAGAWGKLDATDVADYKVGTFDENLDATASNKTAGVGTILIDVNGDEGPDLVCNASNEDCDQYEIQILANGKLRINPEHTRAVEWATINTSIKDTL